MSTANGRTAGYPIDPLFLERWSPRAFQAVSMEEVDLLTMLEAARWAASSYNAQPWRFIYARRETSSWEKFLDLLVPFNRAWASNASALVVFVSNSMMRPPGAEKEAPSLTHSFDAGAASGYFTLQAAKMGWHAHGMAGFDRARAAADLQVPPGYTVEAIYAVGRLGDASTLAPALQARERPSDRVPLSELAFEGAFKGQKH